MNVPGTVAATLARGMVHLAKTSPSPRPDAQILLAYVLGRDRNWLVSHADAFISKPQADTFVSLCEKRAAGTPLAYITGFAGFYRREFAVNENVLIPRPETEHLVEEGVAFLRGRTEPCARAKQLFTVLDVGTGSGAIACSIAAEMPSAIVEGTDTSLKALKVAEHNAQRLNVQSRCKFSFADIVRPNDSKKYDLIVANLPYIPSDDVPQSPDPVGFEPRSALDGGPDGLDDYRRLLEAAPRLLRPGALLLMEAAPPKIAALAGLTAAALPASEIEVRRDYAGLERYLSVKLPARRTA